MNGVSQLALRVLRASSIARRAADLIHWIFIFNPSHEGSVTNTVTTRAHRSARL